MTIKTDIEMKKEEYLHRCARRLIERAEIDEEVALEVAESIWENASDHTDPEDDADEELYYWTDCL